jgi:hypothetical protein
MKPTQAQHNYLILIIMVNSSVVVKPSSKTVKKTVKKPVVKKTVKKPAVKKTVKKPAVKKTVKKPAVKKTVKKTVKKHTTKKSERTDAIDKFYFSTYLQMGPTCKMAMDYLKKHNIPKKELEDYENQYGRNKAKYSFKDLKF